jgi:hypothetical protein
MAASRCRRLVPHLFRVLGVLLLATCRVRYIGREHVKRLAADGRTWVYATWHENTAVTVVIARNRQIAMMASDSRDGEYIARAISLLGNVPVRGSSSKGGGKAVKAMVRLLRSGHSAAVTPDGPRGPRRQAQPGVLWVAVMAGVPVVPCHVVASREWVFSRTWDRHRLPKPFSTVYAVIGEPWTPDRQALRDDEADQLAELERRIQAVVGLAESRVSRA